MTFRLGTGAPTTRAAMSATPTTNEASVSIRSGPLVGAVLGRVVGMLAARAQCPIDRLDDALLVDRRGRRARADAHAPTATCRSSWPPTRRGLELRVGALARGGADSLLADAELPGVGNVFERVADEVARGTPATAPASSSCGSVRLGLSAAARPAPLMPADTAAAPRGDDVRQVDPSS